MLTRRGYWRAEVTLTDTVLKSGERTLDEWLILIGAPPETIGPHSVSYIRVLPSRIDGMIRFRAYGRYDGPYVWPAPLRT